MKLGCGQHRFDISYAGGFSMIDHALFCIPTIVIGTVVFNDPCGVRFNPWVFIASIGYIDLFLASPIYVLPIFACIRKALCYKNGFNDTAKSAVSDSFVFFWIISCLVRYQVNGIVTSGYCGYFIDFSSCIIRFAIIGLIATLTILNEFQNVVGDQNCYFEVDTLKVCFAWFMGVYTFRVLVLIFINSVAICTRRFNSQPIYPPDSGEDKYNQTRLI